MLATKTFNNKLLEDHRAAMAAQVAKDKAYAEEVRRDALAEEQREKEKKALMKARSLQQTAFLNQQVKLQMENAGIPSTRHLTHLISWLSALGVLVAVYIKLIKRRGVKALVRSAGVAAKKVTKTAREIERKVRAERMAREELENLRNLLHDEENWRKQEDAAQARKDRREQMKKEMIEANELQKVFKAEARAREREEEMVLIQKMLDKFQEDERMERENAQKRIQAKKEYIVAIEAQRAMGAKVGEAEAVPKK